MFGLSGQRFRFGELRLGHGKILLGKRGLGRIERLDELLQFFGVGPGGGLTGMGGAAPGTAATVGAVCALAAKADFRRAGSGGASVGGRDLLTGDGAVESFASVR